MTFEIYFSLITSIISIIFAILLAIQYFQRRKNHQLIWTVAFTMFFLATLLEFLAEPEIMGGTVLMYKIYYAFAPVMVALPWLMPELKLLLAFLLSIIAVANLTFKFVLEE